MGGCLGSRFVGHHVKLEPFGGGSSRHSRDHYTDALDVSRGACTVIGVDIGILLLVTTHVFIDGALDFKTPRHAEGNVTTCFTGIHRRKYQTSTELCNWWV